MKNLYIDFDGVILDTITPVYDLAKKSYDIDEIPVGAIVVRNGKIISEGINSRESMNSVIGHAEINAIEDACKVVGDWRLDDCEMYVTLDPCPMCASAIKQSRIRNVYSALNNSDEKEFKRKIITSGLLTIDVYNMSKKDYLYILSEDEIVLNTLVYDNAVWRFINDIQCRAYYPDCGIIFFDSFQKEGERYKVYYNDKWGYILAENYTKYISWYVLLLNSK